MFLQKAMKQGRNVYGICSCDACSKICPYNIKGVWSHNMGDMPTPFLFLPHLHYWVEDRPAKCCIWPIM